MNILIDTHVLLWWPNDDPKITSDAREAIAAGANMVFVSTVSIWEIRIKQALGKLEVPNNFVDVLNSQPFGQLDITAVHAHAVGDLPMHHRDPFDRMLIAQAIIEKMALVTKDVQFELYPVSLIKA